MVMLAPNLRAEPLCSGIFLACLLWRLDSNFSGIVLCLFGPPGRYVFRHNLRHGAYRLSIGTSMCFGVLISMSMLLFALTPRVKRK